MSGLHRKGRKCNPGRDRYRFTGDLDPHGRARTRPGDDGEHYGIIGMRERAEAIGAQLAVVSRPGAGTTVRVEIPGEPVPIPSRIA
ncbi:MAG: hypothetical protein ACKOOG_09100, partial [Actinomycetota bacterium]